jgi:hypothetical protein
MHLPGVVVGDWVFAVGNDWDKAVAGQRFEAVGPPYLAFTLMGEYTQFSL